MQSPAGIRPMTTADSEEVLAMMRVFYASPAVLSNGSEEIFQRDIAACVGDSPYASGYVFDLEGKIVGYGMVAKSFSTEYGGFCLWIEDLYVQEAYRGQGLGARFLDFVARSFPEAVLLRLEVEAENLRALEFYKRCGYSELPYMEMKRLR